MVEYWKPIEMLAVRDNEIEALQAKLKQAEDRVREEKESRVKWQDLVYKAMILVDRKLGNKVTKGKGCTVDDFIQQLESALKQRAASQIDCLNCKMSDMQQEDIDTLQDRVRELEGCLREAEEWIEPDFEGNDWTIRNKIKALLKGE